MFSVFPCWNPWLVAFSACLLCRLSVCQSVCLRPLHTHTHGNTHSQDLVTYHFLPVTNYAHINFYKTFLALPFYFMFLFVTTASHTHLPAHSHTQTHTRATHTCSKCLTIFAAHKSRQQKWARSITRCVSAEKIKSNSHLKTFNMRFQVAYKDDPTIPYNVAIYIHICRYSFF